jgi:hypothetical protein
MTPDTIEIALAAVTDKIEINRRILATMTRDPSFTKAESLKMDRLIKLLEKAQAEIYKEL